MKKIITLTIIGILVFSGLGATAQILETRTTQKQIEKQIISFSQPTFTEKHEFIKLVMNNANSWIDEPGNPLLPAYIETFTYPFGTKIKDIQVVFSNQQQLQLPQPVLPVPQPEPLIQDIQVEFEPKINEEIYQLKQDYPSKDYDYFVTAGLNRLNHVIFVTVKCYPVHYKPVLNLLTYSETVEITIEYQLPPTQQNIEDEYDLLIISPNKFAPLLEKLIKHKNSHGIETRLITTEEIYETQTGYDSPEQIKYQIKEEFDNHNITYVLLVGGLKSIIYADRRDDHSQGTKFWHLPVRYTSLYDYGGYYDPGYISDLYYADLYDGYGNFSSWDPDGDGIYAEWWTGGKEDLDMVPEVLVGRLACRNKFEVRITIDKIIKYETNTAGQDWFNTMVLIGGDTFDDVAGENYYEGEVETQKSFEYMTGFDAVKVWGSNRDTGGLVPVPKDIIDAISDGCGFLAFAGHGSPARWNTYWPEDFESERAKGIWYYQMPFLLNGYKLPVCVVGGCHNSQFNITMTCYIVDPLWTYSPVPECFSWILTRKIGGGTIATIGNTGLGYGATGNTTDWDGDGVDEPDCIERRGGYIETQFFRAYGQDGIDILGETWGEAIKTFLNVYPPMNQILDCKTVQQWALLGDPSLKIGGYSS